MYDMKGTSVGDFDVADDVLVLEKGRQAVHDAVVAHRNALRAGTASTKHKSEVRGTGAKPWKQKGSGRARAGYRQSPVWRGGAAAFGPKPRDYRVKMNKKEARLAFKRALSERVQDGSVKVVDAIDLPEAKTRHMVSLLGALGITGPALVVVESATPAVTLACRNLSRVEVVEAAKVSVYQLVRYPVVVASRGAMAALVQRLDGSKGKEGSDAS